MKIISLNVARPNLMMYRGTTINTGILKKPVLGKVMLRTLNLDGDRQADLSVHGGPYKALYAYPFEHYAFWKRELLDANLEWGAFGENLTTEGLVDHELHIGDRFGIGSAVIMVRQPRMPCYKLAAKFRRDDIIDRFLASGRSGVYFSVETEGEIEEGNSIEPLSREENAVSIGEVNRLLVSDRYNRELLEKAIATPALPESWREYFVPRLNGPAEGTCVSQQES